MMISSSSKIYLIMGHSGEFGDYETWPVVAYWKEEDARKHAEKAHEAAEAIYKRQMNADTYHYDPVHEETEWDKRCFVDYTGTDYRVETIELYENTVWFDKT